MLRTYRLKANPQKKNNLINVLYFRYETDNFISQREEGQLITVNGINSIAVRGVYSYIAPNGQLIKTEYVADENGFRAFGDHLPKSFFI